MADFVDPCCVASTMAVQLTKPDKNNNTTANVDDGAFAFALLNGWLIAVGNFV